MNDKIDDSICPLCKSENSCAVNSLSACWCMVAEVPAALLAQLPDKQRNKSCICQACIEAHHVKAATVKRKTQ
jgi:hypothetical protein